MPAVRPGCVTKKLPNSETPMQITARFELDQAARYRFHPVSCNFKSSIIVPWQEKSQSYNVKGFKEVLNRNSLWLLTFLNRLSTRQHFGLSAAFKFIWFWSMCSVVDVKGDISR